jgi:hypothetical protein
MREKIEVLKKRIPRFDGLLVLGVNNEGEYIVRNSFRDFNFTSYAQALEKYEALLPY